MSYYKAVFDLGRPLSVKVPEERDIYVKMSANPLFATPPVPYVDFLAALEDQDKAIQQAEFGGIERINTMRSKERVVDGMIRQYRSMVTVIANGDTDIILSSGFRHTKPRASAGAMPKVEAVRRLPGGASGELKLRWKPVNNVGLYQVEVRPLEEGEDPKGTTVEEETGKEENWVPHSSRPARIVIAGLKPLLYYAVRVRAKGVKGFGEFSDILVVLVT